MQSETGWQEVVVTMPSGWFSGEFPGKARTGGIRVWTLHKCKKILRTGSVKDVLGRIVDRIDEVREEAKKYNGNVCCRKCGAVTYSNTGKCIVRECRGESATATVASAKQVAYALALGSAVSEECLKAMSSGGISALIKKLKGNE